MNRKKIIVAVFVVAYLLVLIFMPVDVTHETKGGMQDLGLSFSPFYKLGEEWVPVLVAVEKGIAPGTYYRNLNMFIFVVEIAILTILFIGILYIFGSKRNHT